jgi:hypothetical protein
VNATEIARRTSVRALEEIGRVRLSTHFFLRDFLYSEIAQVFGILNIPDDVDLAVEAGSRLCNDLLEPLKSTFGDVRIRSGYRSPSLNSLGNRLKLSCASNEKNYAGHIWDKRDAEGRIGATATVVIPWFADRYADGADWRAMAWWVHDNLPYSRVCFYPKLAAFNIQWREDPERIITSWIEPRGVLTVGRIMNIKENHSEAYAGFPELQGTAAYTCSSK